MLYSTQVRPHTGGKAVVGISDVETKPGAAKRPQRDRKAIGQHLYVQGKAAHDVLQLILADARFRRIVQSTRWQKTGSDGRTPARRRRWGSSREQHLAIG